MDDWFESGIIRLMKNVFSILQLVSALLLSICILVQVKGNGFGRVWGSGAQSFTRRGLESLVFKFTIVLSFLFLAFSLAAFLS